MSNIEKLIKHLKQPINENDLKEFLESFDKEAERLSKLNFKEYREIYFEYVNNKKNKDSVKDFIAWLKNNNIKFVKNGK